MKLLPASLLWRTLIVMVAALVLSEAAAMWLLHRYVTHPRYVAHVEQFVSHLRTIGAAMDTMGPQDQLRFMTEMADKEGIRIVAVHDQDRMLPAGNVPPGTAFADLPADWVCPACGGGASDFLPVR